VIAHWNNSPQVDIAAPLGHIILIPNQKSNFVFNYILPVAVNFQWFIYLFNTCHFIYIFQIKITIEEVILASFLYGHPVLGNEWLLFSTKSTIFQLYHGKNKLYFDEMMMMMSALY
jgi:hypothetical protein